jgi:hypothetical protein
MSEDVYYLDVLVKTRVGERIEERLENRAYIPTRSGSLLEEFTNITFEDEKTGRVITGGLSRGNFIRNPFHSESSVVLDTKDIFFIYLCFFIPSIILLIACLCYIYTSQVLDVPTLTMFYIFGILLSIIDLRTLCLPRCMETTTTMSINIVFFILGTITFTCSVLIIYFSKIQLDAEQDTTTTLIICVVFIVIFAILTLYYIFKSKEPEDPTAKKIREKYGTINANRISESG